MDSHRIETASKIELEARLAKLNWILRQLEAGELSSTYRKAQRSVRRRRTVSSRMRCVEQ
jgi:hypothetical protein